MATSKSNSKKKKTSAPKKSGGAAAPKKRTESAVPPAPVGEPHRREIAGGVFLFLAVVMGIGYFIREGASSIMLSACSAACSAGASIPSRRSS